MIDLVRRVGQVIGRRLEQPIARLLNADRRTKRMVAFSADAVMALIAAWLAFSIRLGSLYVVTGPLWLFAATALFVSMISLSGHSVYDNVFRFHGSRGLAQIVRACLLAGLVLLGIFGVYGVPGVPRTVSFMFPVIMFALIAITRIVARYVLVEMLADRTGRQRVVIFGAGVDARHLGAQVLLHEQYKLLAYSSDDPAMEGQSIDGTRIIGAAGFGRLLREGKIDLVLLASADMPRARRAALIEQLQRDNVSAFTLPRLEELVRGDISLNDLREIDVADLLSRDPVEPDPVLLAKAIAGKVVLVTGAGGSIGSELCRQIARLGVSRLVMSDMSEVALYTIENELAAARQNGAFDCEIIPELGSLHDRDAVERLFARWRPDTVYHAAAYKHVPLVEANPVAGVRNNVFSTLYCVEVAQETGVERFVLVSTDKAVRPTNVMGASKRVCEQIVQAVAKETTRPIFSIVRFGNVLGSSGSVVPQFRRQIEAGGPITLTHGDVTRYFMTIPEAAELVIQAGAMAAGGEVFLLDMGEPVRIAELARSMVVMSGRTVRDAENPDGDIEIIEVGLRPGEKLYEELLIDAHAEATSHRRIFAAKEGHPSIADLRLALDQMACAVGKADGGSVRIMLQRLVDGYAPPDETSAVPSDLSRPATVVVGSDIKPW